MTRYVVYGLGISGISAAKFLFQNGENVVATDDNEKAIDDAKTKFPKINFLKSDEVKYDADTQIIFAPGIPLYFPTRHKILEIVKKTGAKLMCDIEAFYKKNHEKNFIGITGTNGKSTTTALTGFIFKELGISSEVGGNIGVPCFDLPKVENYIFETSSFQLDLLGETHFKIAALLNITPDHIDRHGSMQGYIDAKKRIFQNQNEKDFALIDVDNENSKKVFSDLKNDKNFSANLIPISTQKIYEGGVALIDGVLTSKIMGEDFSCELKSKFLRGQHNEQNMAFAFAISHLSLQEKTNLEIIEVIKKFTGLRHRMQLLGEIHGIKFVNDSKATNAESTENALKAYENIFWILGGKAKDGGILALIPYFKKIEKAYLIGESSDEFAKILEENSVNFVKCETLENAFKSAFADAEKSSLSEKNILLSPACASFDQWKNFEQRGDYFCQLFEEHKKL